MFHRAWTTLDTNSHLNKVLQKWKKQRTILTFFCKKFPLCFAKYGFSRWIPYMYDIKNASSGDRKGTTRSAWSQKRRWLKSSPPKKLAALTRVTSWHWNAHSTRQNFGLSCFKSSIQCWKMQVVVFCDDEVQERWTNRCIVWERYLVS